MKLQTFFFLVFVVCLAAACSDSAAEDTEPGIKRIAESQPPRKQNVKPQLEARFEVTAEGNFIEEGKFTAWGHCRA